MGSYVRKQGDYRDAGSSKLYPTHRAMLEPGCGHTNTGISDLPLDNRIEVLDLIQPNFILGSPSFVRYLGERLAELGKKYPWKIVCGAGEPGLQVSKKYRQRIADAYGVSVDSVFEMFGSTDATIHNMDCPAHEGIHLWVDRISYEVVDPVTKKRVPNGTLGVMVITTHFHRSHPWIRYYTEDYCIIDERPCSCGRTHPRLTQGIMGRVGNEIYIGGKIFMYSDLERAVSEVDETTGNYQAIKYADKMEELRVKVELKPGLDPSDEMTKKVQKQIESDLGVPAKVELVKPGVLPVATWKAQRVV